jgi:DNA-binding beta-propeller fold protein YncE
MIAILIFVLIVVLLVIGYFFRKTKSKADYEIENPVFQQYLSENLKEISGISHYAHNQIISINDEIGRLFIYDFNKQEIIDTLDFDVDGDYEDVVFLENIAYILRSDGNIIAFDINTKNTKTFDGSHNDVEEYEGLGFEPKTNSLLLAAKIMQGDKTIFQYDLNNEKLTKKFKIQKEDISKNGKHGKEFKPSGIAVHPKTNEIYVLASAGKKLLVLNENGKKLHQYNLDEDQFPQPEGICFTPNGDLIISSEGKKDQASISYFSYKSKNN